MKKLFYPIIAVLCLCVTSCDEDDIKPTVVTTTDYTVETKTNVSVGDTIGIVPGTSNKGTVTYNIVSQTPNNAFSIGETYGELKVADVSVFDATVNPSIALEVEIRKESVTKISNVTVNLIQCNDLDLSTWVGDLVLEEEFAPPIDVTGIAIECGTLLVSGPILLCSNDIDIFYQLTPSPTNPSIGTVFAPITFYDCDGPQIGYGAEGTYDMVSGTITIDYGLYFDPDTRFIDGTQTIKIRP